MEGPVEAQSLSALTALLANPPQYPRNPTHFVHEPLTLYIVRVPGSRGELVIEKQELMADIHRCFPFPDQATNQSIDQFRGRAA